MTKANLYNVVLLILIILEGFFLFYSYPDKISSQSVNSVCMFATSILTGIVILFKFYNIPVEVSYVTSLVKRRLFLVLFYGACLLALNIITIPFFKLFDYNLASDIIPTIQVLAKRFITGEYPYKTIASLGHTTPPPYFTMHWLPYCVSEIFHFDPRTITFSIWCLAVFTLMYRSARANELWLQLTVPILICCGYLAVLYGEPTVIGGTVEMMVAGYYIFLMVSLDPQKSYRTALFISICLLSRYFVVLWLPLYAFVLFASGNRKQLVTVIATTIVLIFVLFVIPFLSKDWSYLQVAYTDYERLPLGEWFHLNDQGFPTHLYQGIGFAHIFYEKYRATDTDAGYYALKQLLFVAIAFALIIMGVWYWINKRKINVTIFLLASFKIYLSIFLVLMPVPYKYLAVTGFFVSIAVFAEQARYRLKEDA